MRSPSKSPRFRRFRPLREQVTTNGVDGGPKWISLGSRSGAPLNVGGFFHRDCVLPCYWGDGVRPQRSAPAIGVHGQSSVTDAETPQRFRDFKGRLEGISGVAAGRRRFRTTEKHAISACRVSTKVPLLGQRRLYSITLGQRCPPRLTEAYPPARSPQFAIVYAGCKAKHSDAGCGLEHRARVSQASPRPRPAE